MKGEGGKVDGRKERQGRDLLFLAFPKVGPVRLYPRLSKGIANVKVSPFQTCLTPLWLEVRFRDTVHPGKKGGRRHQLATEKQMKMVLVMCRY